MSRLMVETRAQGSSVRTRPRRAWARAVRNVEYTLHASGNWLRVDVEREGESRSDTLGVCGYSAVDEPVTAFSLLGPKDRNVYLEILSEDPVSYIKVTEPFFDDRQLARIAIHGFRTWYGEPTKCIPGPDCGCEFPLGAAWRWFEACEVEGTWFPGPNSSS